MLMRSAIGTLSRAGERGRLSIFIFHRVLDAPDPLFPGEVDIARFGEMLDWIGDWFNVLPLSQAVDALAAGKLPARAAAITFDDGYADNLINAAPCLAARGMTATFFIATGFLNGGRMFNDCVIESIRRTRAQEFDLAQIGLGRVLIGTTAEKRAAIDQILQAVKHKAPAERADAVQCIVEESGAELPSDLMLTSAQLRELAARGMGIGAHTVTHPILASTAQTQARREIAESREHLEGLLRQRVGLFAYPNGKPGQDYLAEHVEIVRQLGFDGAVSTSWGTGRQGGDRYQIPRFTPWDREKLPFGLRLLRNMRTIGECA